MQIFQFSKPKLDMCEMLRAAHNRAMAQAVSHQPLTAEAKVHA
jgi:hypothetical protein